jgi:outer membrane protein
MKARKAIAETDNPATGFARFEVLAKDRGAHHLALFAFIVLALLPQSGAVAGMAGTNLNSSPSLGQPLSLQNCLDLALSENAAIQKSQRDLEAEHGVSIQIRSIVVPKVRLSSDYQITDDRALEKIPGLGVSFENEQRWGANIRLVQSVYEGGRITSSLRTARLSVEHALLRHHAVIADTLLEVRTSFYDILLANQLILVQEASVHLLSKELEDAKVRFEAGTVPRFNLLRAEVELANARPRLIRSRNALRLAKNNLANLLGFDLRASAGEDVPLSLAGQLDAEPFEIDLNSALAAAVRQRPELGVLRKAEGLSKESIISARAGFKPRVELFGGYGSRSSTFSQDLTRDLSGWFAGGQLTWDLFDGGRSRGKLIEAKALAEKARLEVVDKTRQVEFEVRTSHSNLREARELLESQNKVQEQAEEALRLATVRNQAGTGTQLDLLNAQTALTEARTTRIQALRDYSVARAKLERAIGQQVVRDTSR